MTTPRASQFRAKTVLATCLAVLCAPQAMAQPRPLAIDLRPGISEKPLREAILSPFAASGQALKIGLAADALATLRATPAGSPVQWDVAQLSGPDTAAACRDGLVEKIDPALVGGRDKMIPQALSDCGIGAIYANLVLTWDRDKTDRDKSMPVPTGWADFFDIAKFPGKRGLRRGPRGNLEIALLADGVAPGDVYKLLRTDDGLDRAFRKLDQLRPYVVWWTDAEPAPRQLITGEVLMSSASNVRVAAANPTERRNFAMQWNGGIGMMDFWVLAKGAAPEIQVQAQALLKFAADPKQLAAIPPLAAYGLPAKGAAEGIAVDLLAPSPNAADHTGATLWQDDGVWRDNEEKLGQRFAAFLIR